MGFPKVFCVLTHGDKVREKFFKRRRKLRERLEKEIAAGCKIFEMPFNAARATYQREKVQTCARCIVQQKYAAPL